MTKLHVRDFFIVAAVILATAAGLAVIAAIDKVTFWPAFWPIFVVFAVVIVLTIVVVWMFAQILRGRR